MPAISKKQINVDARRKTASGRFYQIIPESDYISITNALESISKPALYAWSAKVEREACLDVACRMAFSGGTVAGDIIAYRKELEGLLGKQKASTRLASAAAEIGTATHSLIEWWARTKLGLAVGPRPTVGEKSEWGFMAFEDWAKQHEFKPIRSEMVVFSHKHEIAGTLDLLGYVDGQIQTVDIKTGKAVYAEAKCQCAAYWACLLEMGEPCSDSAIVLRLPKVDTDPDFEAVPVDNLGYHFQAFLHAKELRLWQIETEKEYHRKMESLKSKETI